MTNWLEVAKFEIPKLSHHSTVITANRNLSSVLAVPHAGKLDFFNSSNVSIGSSIYATFDEFFNISEGLGIELLGDDKTWIKQFLLFTSQVKLNILLNQYIEIWIYAMNKESVSFRKQNAGRRAANIFLRESKLSACK